MIAESAADDQSVLEHARGVFREDSLTGRIHTSAENAPLTAVGMTADSELNARFLNIRYEIFGMMTKKDAETVLCGKTRERFGVRLVLFLVDAGGQSAEGKSVKLDAIVVKIDHTAIAHTSHAFLVKRDRYGMTPRVALVVAGDLMVAE